MMCIKSLQYKSCWTIVSCRCWKSIWVNEKIFLPFLANVFGVFLFSRLCSLQNALVVWVHMKKNPACMNGRKLLSICPTNSQQHHLHTGGKLDELEWFNWLYWRVFTCETLWWIVKNLTRWRAFRFEHFVLLFPPTVLRQRVKNTSNKLSGVARDSSFYRCDELDGN